MELDNFSFHFANAAKQIFKFPACEVLGASLVGSHNFRSPSLCAVSYPRKFPELPLTTCRVADVLFDFAFILA